jgi:hypothetical protein
MIHDSFRRNVVDRDDLIGFMVEKGILLGDGKGDALFHALDRVWKYLGLHGQMLNNAGPDAIGQALSQGALVLMELGGAGHVIVVDAIGEDDHGLTITIRDPERDGVKTIHRPAMMLMRPTGRIWVVHS